ncbi:acyltransferase [Thioploca ingrica]|jgi:hypothetical protein|uniref:Acyltransferase n=1 Tax=Thioploca ingrica TaxID=40754 RepID=A0A090AJY7_9GAMM|nr:acyltransferase [Thioploca ingrica]
MDELAIDRFILGETNEEFLCSGTEPNQQATIAMITQTQLHLDILSRDFDPDIYDNQDCCDAIEQLALRSRHSRIRILLHNPKKATQRGHRIIYLRRRLGSLIQFRHLAEIHQPIQETFLLADSIGFIYRPYADSLSATINFKDYPRVKELLLLFEKLWQDSEPDPETMDVII